MSAAEEIEKLKRESDAAWDRYDKLRTPANAAYKEYEAACEAHKNAVIYEKARRKVMRDLISGATPLKEDA